VPDLTIQIQPKRQPTLDLARALAKLANVAATRPSVRELHIRKGCDRGPYIDITFTVPANEVAALWRQLSKNVLGKDAAGRKLRLASMVYCQGSRGWDNYRLLHHFDPEVVLDG
jgi:hypothetical protein